MVGSQEQLRIRVVQFFQRIRRTDAGWTRTTVRHFIAEGVQTSTVYRIINRYLTRGSTKHKKGGGRPRRIRTSFARARLRRLTNHQTGIISQRALASRFSCSQAYIICKVIKRLKIRCRKRVKAPMYKNDAAIREAKKMCRRLYNKFKNLDFVIDDEKYFGLSGFQMSGNRFITSLTPPKHRIKSSIMARKNSSPK